MTELQQDEDRALTVREVFAHGGFRFALVGLVIMAGVAAWMIVVTI